MGQANQYTINSCGIYDCNTAWRWNSKGSRDYNLWAVFRGEGTLSLFGTSYSALTGTCFLIPPQTPTNGTHNPNSRLFVYSVHFSTNGVSIPLDSKRIPNVPFFKELFDRVIRFYNMNRSELAQTYLEVLLNEFFTAPDTPSNKQTPENIAHRRCVTEICDRINSAPEVDHKLSALAAEYGYSATYLGKLFHKLVGVSFSNYLLNARINCAKLCLANSELSISEIAERLGYYDAAHFINQFKKIVGCTPSSFR